MKRTPSLIMAILLIGGIITGIVGLLSFSIKLAILYALLTIVSLVLIIFSYCGKCTCRLERCSCIFPGKFTRYLPARKQMKYSRLDIIGVMLGFSVITLFPQYWLFQNKTMLVLFWILLFLAHLQIRLFVCGSCENLNCPVLPGKQQNIIR